MIGVYFVAAALFWSVFEQAGSTLNLFADRSTNNVMPVKGAFPSSWWQSLNALLIFVLAPVFAWLWVKLGDRQPATPTKFALGLIGVGLGFLVLIPGAQLAESGAKVGVSWLFMVYMIHTIGRAVPESGRAELDDQAGAGAHRQPDDGRLVPRRVGRQLPRRSGGVVLRDAAASPSCSVRSPSCRSLAGVLDAALPAEADRSAGAG